MFNDFQFNPNSNEQMPFGVVHHGLSNILPTASEIGNLFASFLAENMSVCMLKHMVAKSKDPDIKPILQQALAQSSQRVQSMNDLFKTIQHPIPDGFGEDDVDCNAPELFSEIYCLSYTRIMNVYIGLKYLYSLSRSSRSDFRQFFYNGIKPATDIHQKAADVLLAKGLFVKTPNAIIPDMIGKVNDKHYYGSMLRGNRPLNALEISHIYSCIEISILSATLELGFCQVITDKKIKNHIYQGSQIHNEHVKILSTILNKENLPAPVTTDYHVTTSKQSPFSDKLMLFHDTTVTGFSLLDKGFALSSTSRKDISSAFSRIATEILEYCKEGTDLTIENGWLEKVPETANRSELIQ